MPWILRQAAASDFLPIAALDRIAWLHTGEAHIADGEHVWRVWCEYATVIVAAAEEMLAESGSVAGAVVMFPTTSFPTKGCEHFLHKIMVHPACRGRGLGSELMRAALERATAPVLLTVDPANEAAVKLYGNFGFTIHEHVRGYYRAHEDRLVMRYDPAGGRAS